MRTQLYQGLAAFIAAGYIAFPLRAGTKRPAHRGWRTRDYTNFDPFAWLARSGNVGLRLAPADLVIDLDPRNIVPGDDPLGRLSAKVGVDLTDAPMVITGSGGRHFFWAKPGDMRVRAKLDGYTGIDFKTGGGFVVAPGSTHPDTGRPYKFAPHSLPIALVDYAPDGLLDLLHKADVLPRRQGTGVIEPDQLGVLLDALDPEAFGAGRYDDWIRLAAACHDATNGGGLAEFTAWCMRDLDYSHVDAHDSIEHHWRSFRAGKAGGVTYRTLFRAVIDAGRSDLIAQINTSLMFDFDDGGCTPALDFGSDDGCTPALDFENDDGGSDG